MTGYEVTKVLLRDNQLQKYVKHLETTDKVRDKFTLLV